MKRSLNIINFGGGYRSKNQSYDNFTLEYICCFQDYLVEMLVRLRDRTPSKSSSGVIYWAPPSSGSSAAPPLRVECLQNAEINFHAFEGNNKGLEGRLGMEFHDFVLLEHCN